MKAAQIRVENTASDRQVLRAAVTLLFALSTGLVCTILARLGPMRSYGDTLSWINTGAVVISLIALARGAPLAIREMAERRRYAASALDSRRQIENLFQMTDMLQSALGYDDANAVLRATASQLLAGFGGALYVFNNSRDRLDLSTCWDWPQDHLPPDTVSPSHCWALKRGKPHVNHVGATALRCEHLTADVLVLEIPMMARGEVYGLLCIQSGGEAGEVHLGEITPLAAAVADAMSLALSNISLREKLRTQALRDPLTGLYNRRYMEDVLERCVNLSERNGSALSVVMIDLDHFKLLNDEHGHALGDAVLREVAGAIVGAIRPCDVACRYGGEELLVILPDCSLDDAATKANVLRARIESLSDNHQCRVTASFGVASMPDNATKASELVAAADGALYAAKQSGRNRVVAAERRNVVVVDSITALAGKARSG
ncbi:sensor domain-containing diguanylate cyclase [Sphingomonas nostoxanthinifaciens]|uniref:sensor domain-containing diguanylate cyclase n=1 Tax=Sphingomonas nostoxanthinifaciens TaxID=2872652 RepID=UPI001CC2121A|nr:sensor domain-containing diguanylate cyclase [Sphingomonas nostoxanthinifaciens]UAK25476.1 sensor domain-containing diguanylate cyclase [Sphingomonas nostoxanthinifaciens]